MVEQGLLRRKVGMGEQDIRQETEAALIAFNRLSINGGLLFSAEEGVTME